MGTTKISYQPATQIDWDKVKRDLALIKSLQQFLGSKNWRTVVYGGYGLDILLGQITRTHNDVDIVTYGQSNRELARTSIQDFLSQLVVDCSFEVSENDFMVTIDLHSRGIGANIYYVQVVDNPFNNLNNVIKSDGETITNTEKQFPPPMRGKLDDLEIDVQNPSSHLADILFKQRTLTHKISHDQDISNLRQITEVHVVDEIISLS